MNTFNRLLLRISLQIAVLSGFLCAQQPVEQKPIALTEKPQKNDAFSPDLAQFLNNQTGQAPKLDEMQGLMEVLKKSKEMSEKRRQAQIARLFEGLPAETKNTVEKARQKYQAVILACNLGDCLSTVNKNLNAILKENASVYQDVLSTQKYDAVVRGVESLLIALTDGSFNALLPATKTGGFVMPLVSPMESEQISGATQRKLSLTLTQVTQMRTLFMEVWGKLGNGITDPKILAVRNEIYFLTLVLYAVEKQDPYALIKQCVARMRPELLAATKLLSGAIKRLEACAEQAEKSKNRALRSAIRQWTDELRRNERVIQVFNSVDQRMRAGSLSPEKFQQLFSCVGYVYHYFGKEFLNLWAKEVYKGYKTSNGAPVQGDYDSWFFARKSFWINNALGGLFSGALTMWFFDQHQSDFLSSFVQMTMTNSKEQNLAQVGKEVNVNMAALMMPGMMPGGMGEKTAVQSMMNGFMMSEPLWISRVVGGSQAASVFFNPIMFMMHLPKEFELGSKVFTSWVYYNCFHNKLFGGGKLWNPDDAGIKHAMKDVFDEGKNYIRNYLYLTLAYSQPELWKTLEEKTLGIVKPEMLTTLLDACWPAVITNIKGISGWANLKRTDYYKTDTDEWFTSHYSQTELNQRGFAQCDLDWIKWNMCNYVATSFGEHVGRKLSYSETVRGFFSDCFNGLVARGWISQDFAAISDEFELGIDKMLDQVRTIFLEPKIREPLVWELKNLRILDYYEHDDKKINYELLKKGLGMLQQKGYIDFSEVVELVTIYRGASTKKNPQDALLTLQERQEKELEEETEKVERTLTRFKEIIKNKFTGYIGSSVGGWVMGKLARIGWDIYDKSCFGSEHRPGLLADHAKIHQRKDLNNPEKLNELKFEMAGLELAAIGDVFA
ncbi:MAG: hypothetical protein WCT20_04615 [Candidatus Babeliales bacterium]